MSALALEQTIPAFTAESTHGEFNTKQLKGKLSVIYFYPRDNTPGCTTEAQDFRDHYQKFKELGCEIYGISRDTLKSHEKFSEKQELPFALIADPEETVCNMFDVMKQKNMYGKQVRGIERSTFIFDADAKLVKEWRKVKVPDHVTEVLSVIQELSN